VDPCWEQDAPSLEYMLKIELDGDDTVAKEIGIDLEGEEPGDVSKYIL
jgi:hypothetical protein